MKKLLNYFAIDKQLHYLYGYKISSILFLLISVIPMLKSTLRFWEVGIIAMVLTFFPALYKELTDKEIDKKDILATIIGALVASIQNTILVYGM